MDIKLDIRRPKREYLLEMALEEMLTQKRS